MPMRDGTGPFGEGPITGRGMGPCGRGYRRWGGLSRGFSRRRSPGPLNGSVDDEKYLKEQKKILQEELDELDNQLDSLKKNRNKKK
jgi:hypothetical protein